MIVEAPKFTFDSKPLPEIDLMADSPPAYSFHSGVAPLTSNTGSHPPPTVDQVHIFSRHEDIKGTFYVDPHIPSLGRSHGGCRRKSRKQLPHASFRTRKADISIDLGTTGDAYDAKKANIAVATRKGNIRINLLPTIPIRPLGLDVTSHKGNIVLFLPKTFSGVVHLMTRKGEMTVLPGLASVMQVVKTSNKEIIFMIAPQDSADNSCETTLCQLNTRKGNVVVGLSGYDQYAPQPGFWKRLGGYLCGDKL